MKKLFLVIMIFIMLVCLSACASIYVKGTVSSNTDNGDAILDIMPQKIMEKANIGDTVTVSIGDFCEEMPFVDEMIKEDGKLQLFLDKNSWSITVCIYDQDFLKTYNIDLGEKVFISK